MLTELFIRDLAIIETLRLDFAAGLTVLTGETGAGKSILLDALKLATGARADSTLIRHGADQAEVVARFEVDGALFPEAIDGELLLRRVLARDGRSRAYVNDAPCAIGRLRALGEGLLEIHGQHEHYRLTRSDAQLELLDLAVDDPELRRSVADLAQAWQRANEQLAALRRDATLSPAERELIAYQVAELAPEVDAAQRIEALHADHRRLASREELVALVEEAREALGEQIDAALVALEQRLARGARLDPALEEGRQLVEAALISVQEAAQALNGYQRDLDDGPGTLAELERQLERLHDLARKHRVDVADLPAEHARLEQRLAQAAGAEAQEGELAAERERLAHRWAERAATLSARRTAAAAFLSTAVTDLMHALGMQQGRFRIAVETNETLAPRPSGRDQVVFEVTANAGQPLQPLARVASGGELARIGLALRVALAIDGGPGTLVFDEVDSGVGGRVAAIVGNQLRALSEGRQVLCVTHLPQVASRGHQHSRVEKRTSDGRTRTCVAPLDGAARVDEIARMLGGLEITDRTREHARELLGLTTA